MIYFQQQRVILRCYLNVTQSIAGCQAIRRRIGHCLFGFRVVAGECIFVTISPNRRWSQLIMRCSRIRPNDPMANADIRSDSGHVSYRARHADASSPGLFAELDDEVDLRHLFTEYDDLSAAERKRAKRSVERVSCSWVCRRSLTTSLECGRSPRFSSSLSF